MELFNKMRLFLGFQQESSKTMAWWWLIRRMTLLLLPRKYLEPENCSPCSCFWSPKIHSFFFSSDETEKNRITQNQKRKDCSHHIIHIHTCSQTRLRHSQTLQKGFPRAYTRIWLAFEQNSECKPWKRGLHQVIQFPNIGQRRGTQPSLPTPLWN